MNSSWLTAEAPPEKLGDVVISSRVRLARNLKNIPFPGHGKNEEVWVNDIISALTESAGGSAFVSVPLTDENAVRALMESYAISPAFAKLTRPHALAQNADGSISVMIGEEDHIRLQAFAAGLDLESCFAAAGKLDDLLDERFGYAFSEALGYLTECPTNLGTGMRASVMLHLPALTHSGALRGWAASAAKSGLTIRGLYGEGTQALGCLFQLSNQGSNGQSETEIIGLLTQAARQIGAAERGARELFKAKNGVLLNDRVYRAWGLMTNARLLELKETIDALGDIRVGAAMGLLPVNVSLSALNALLTEIHVSRPDCYEERANTVRRRLK
ncbi:protein-arginine kinase [Clostridia bacterium]|nr:protein-arginine kinase [Clostridia bacterium]